MTDSFVKLLFGKTNSAKLQAKEEVQEILIKEKKSID